MKKLCIVFWALLFTPAFAIYKGVEEKNHSGFSRYVVVGELDKKQYCTGVLIAPDLLLTTAWCAMITRQQTWFYVSKAGVKNEIKPAHGLIHPEFDPSKSSWGVRNVGVLRLVKPLQDNFGDLYKTVPNETIQKGETVTIAAFGRAESEDPTSAGVFRSSKLNVDNPILPHLNGGQLINAPVIDNNKPVPSACTGDWGGGVFKRQNDKDILIGLIVGNVPPKDTLANSCGGQTFIIHLAQIRGWLEFSIDEIRKRDLPK